MAEITIDAKELIVVGQNVNAVQKGSTLILVIDLDKTIGLSKSGKMMGIGSTGGFAPVAHVAKSPRDKAVSINVWVGEK